MRWVLERLGILPRSAHSRIYLAQQMIETKKEEAEGLEIMNDYLRARRSEHPLSPDASSFTRQIEANKAIITEKWMLIAYLERLIENDGEFQKPEKPATTTL